MAYRYVSLVLNGALGLDPTAKLILVVLAEAANTHAGGVAWPSVERMARLACISPRQAQRHLRTLVADGWLQSVGRVTGGRNEETHQGHTTRYKLNIPRLANAAKSDTHVTVNSSSKGDTDVALRDGQRVTLKASKGDAQRDERDIQSNSTVTPTSPEPEFEPEINQKNLKRIREACVAAEIQKPLLRILNTEPEKIVPSAETEAQRIDRIETERRRQLTIVAAMTSEVRGNQ